MDEQGRILDRVAALIDSGELRGTQHDTLSPINAANLREAHRRRLESGRTHESRGRAGGCRRHSRDACRPGPGGERERSALARSEARACRQPAFPASCPLPYASVFAMTAASPLSFASTATPHPLYPTAVRAARPRLLHAAQPRADGLDAHRAGGQGARDFPKLAAYFAERARRRRRPDRHRRLLAQPGRLAQAVRRHAALAVGSAPRIARSPRAVHAHGGRICLQILHAGRYGYSPLQVAPSKLKAPINPFTPRALSAGGVERQIRAFVRTRAARARRPATTASR